MFLTVEGKKIHCSLQGSGTPILFVHGWGGTIESLRSLSSRFTDTNKVILLDLPGFGQSDDPDKEWGVKEYARLLKGLIQQLKLKDTVYFGHSFGGSLGIYLASTNPSLICKLVLCDASYKRSAGQKSNTGSFLKKLPLPAPLLSLIRKIGYRILYPQSDALKFPRLENNFRRIVSYDLTPVIADIKTPTLILWGEKDKDTPVSLAYELNSRIPRSKLVVFPGITHGLPLTNPVAVSGEIKKFI